MMVHTKAFLKDEVTSRSASNGSLDASSTPEEPHVAYIHELAKNGLSKAGHHGEMGAMGVSW